MDREHWLKSFAPDEHIDVMMDTIPTDYFAAHYNKHAYHNSGFSSSMELLSTNSSVERDCNQVQGTKTVSQLYDHWQPSGSNLNGHPVAPHYLFNSGYGKRQQVSTDSGHKDNSMAAMREMIFRIAAMQPIMIDPESVKPAKRRNVKISKDPQSVAARQRRERISVKIRILQRLVPGGTKMDTASMLDEAAHYINFLKTHIQNLLKKAQG